MEKEENQKSTFEDQEQDTAIETEKPEEKFAVDDKKETDQEPK